MIHPNYDRLKTICRLSLLTLQDNTPFGLILQIKSKQLVDCEELSIGAFRFREDLSTRASSVTMVIFCRYNYRQRFCTQRGRAARNRVQKRWMGGAISCHPFQVLLSVVHRMFACNF
jgi:hypothetical protein